MASVSMPARARRARGAVRRPRPAAPGRFRRPPVRGAARPRRSAGRLRRPAGAAPGCAAGRAAAARPCCCSGRRVLSVLRWLPAAAPARGAAARAAGAPGCRLRLRPGCWGRRHAAGRGLLGSSARAAPWPGPGRAPGRQAETGHGSGPRPGRRRAAARRRAPADVEPALEPVEPGGVAALAGGTRQQHAGADQLELQPGRGGAAHLGQPGVDDVGRPGQGARAERARPAGASARAGPRARRAAPTDAPSGTAATTMRSRRRSSRSSTKRRGSWPDSMTLSTAPNTVAELPAASAVDDVVEQLAVGEAEQRGGALVGQPLLPRRRRSAGRARRGSRGPSRRRRGRRGGARPARPPRPRPRTARRGSPAAAAAGPAGTGSGGCATGSCR